jgi:sensor histidine kinase regulating citrate/malate metabolism
MAPTTENGWLRVVIEQMQEDLTEIKGDLKILREERAEHKGRMYIVVGLITIGINLLAVWLKLT